ncbi:MAG TPA: dual specificity protein phosphatase family protein [Gammaproteobacteria bacterium]|jgi:protein-tyrosine phosphatase
MEDLFWVLPGELAGRAGPDREPWDIDALYEAGIRAVLSVNDGRLVHAEDFEARGMVYACVPFTDNAPPRPGDMEICRAALSQAYGFIQTQIGMGKPVMVHCTSGKDRTGLLSAYALTHRFNCSAGEAVTRLRAVRPIALSAMGWEDFAYRLLDNT